jgi:hypothetical protein
MPGNPARAKLIPTNKIVPVVRTLRQNFFKIIPAMAFAWLVFQRLSMRGNASSQLIGLLLFCFLTVPKPMDQQLRGDRLRCVGGLDDYNEIAAGASDAEKLLRPGIRARG